MTWTIHNGDCLEVLRTLADCSVDAVVTDPPYGLSFMGKRWDFDVPGVDVWAECLRVLKPGGHLLAFAGTRTQHRMAVRIEDAGFEIRDMIAWVYGSGFPKSLDVSKAIDKAAGAMGHEGRGMIDAGTGRMTLRPHTKPSEYVRPAPATDAARQWQGWGTALKPAMEPITVARKPLSGTVAENVLTHGTGGLNVDGCRVVRDADDVSGWSQSGSNASENRAMSGANYSREAKPDAAGRWPANLIHDGSEEVVQLFPCVNGVLGARREGGDKSIFNGGGHKQSEKQRIVGGIKDTGSAARFFYCPKASKADRDEGCEGLEFRTAGEMVDREEGSAGIQNPRAGAGRTGGGRNGHPTVKPCDLMRYLCRLVTPPSGIVLDPFTGSGSTGKAAILERFNFIGIEREAEYCEIARARISKAERDVSKELL